MQFWGLPQLSVLGKVFVLHDLDVGLALALLVLKVAVKEPNPGVLRYESSYAQECEFLTNIPNHYDKNLF